MSGKAFTMRSFRSPLVIPSAFVYHILFHFYSRILEFEFVFLVLTHGPGGGGGWGMGEG